MQFAALKESFDKGNVDKDSYIECLFLAQDAQRILKLPHVTGTSTYAAFPVGGVQSIEHVVAAAPLPLHLDVIVFVLAPDVHVSAAPEPCTGHGTADFRQQSPLPWVRRGRRTSTQSTGIACTRRFANLGLVPAG